jgi:alpha-mannosidase
MAALLFFSAILFPASFVLSAAQAVPSTTLLQPEDQAIVARLGDLNHLPQGTWRVHLGDVAHGESVDLDDSSWPAAQPDSDYPSDAIWFRQWIQVPATLHGYDLTGSRIWFQLISYSHGTRSEIIYLNGRRVAMGEDLEPVVLFDQARPGDKALVAVKLLPTLGEKHFTGTDVRVEVSSSRPNPDALQDEFLTAAEFLSSPSGDPPADETTLSAAIRDVNLKALDASDQAAFDASLRAAQSRLEALRPLLKQATFLETGNSHIDAAWLWPWTETVDVVKRTYSTALQLMNEYPSYTFTQSAAQYNAWLADKYPEINEEIKKRIKEGRWEIVGGMWVEPDLNLPDGESIARSILIGKRWYRQNYGVDVRIGWNPDSFGYNWQLPQIYRLSGIDYFVTQKMAWNDTNPLPLKLFWWESPDGSKVLTYLPHGYGNTSLDPVRLAADFKVARQYAPGLNEMMDLYGVSDHGGGPTRAMLDEASAWMKPEPVSPTMRFATAGAFFSDVEKKIAPQSETWDYQRIAGGYHDPADPPAGQVSIPTWKDELYLEFHRGVFTTQAVFKREMRESSEEALNAEKLASLAWLDGDPYPAGELTEAWKKITFNQFHDTAAGSAIGVVYEDAKHDYDQVRLMTGEIRQEALATIAARIDTGTDTGAGAGVPVLVFNSLGWERSGIATVSVQMPEPASAISVLDSTGRVLPSQILRKDEQTHTFQLLVGTAHVPSVGYEVLHVVPGTRPAASDLHVHGTTLENAALRVVIDPKSGCITSLYDRKANFETLAAGACGNELEAFTDLPKKYDAWNIDPGTLDEQPVRLTRADSVQLVEEGPLRAVVRVTRTWQSSKFVQDIELSADSDQVVVVNDIDWHERHVLLKAAFQLAASGPFATYEIPYGSIQRPTTRNNSWEKARFEVPALRWADLGGDRQGMSLINDSKYGYDAVGNLLRLSLLRAPTYPDPNADQGRQQFSYALYPHAGKWQQVLTVRRGYEFNDPLAAMQVEAHGGLLPPRHSFIAIEPSHVTLTAVKKAEDSHALVLHLYEWAGQAGEVSITVPPGFTNASQTNLMEDSDGPALPVENGKISVAIRPYQIVVIKVNYPEAGAAGGGAKDELHATH